MKQETISILLTSSRREEALFVEELFREARHGSYSVSWMSWPEVLRRGLDDAGEDAVIRLCSSAELGLSPQLPPGTGDGRTVPVILVVTDDAAPAVPPVVGDLPTPPLHKSEVSPSLLDRMIRFGIERTDGADHEHLRGRDNRFKTLIENSLDIITVLDEAGVIRFASPSVLHLLGYESEALIGRKVLDLMHPEDAGPAKQLFKDTVGGGDAVVSTEVRFRHADGSWRMLEANGRRLPTDSARTRIVVNARDVTLRKKAERDLKRSQDLLRVVINSAPIVLLAVAEDGTITLAEGLGLTAVSGLSSRVAGESVYEVFEKSPALLYDVRRALRGETFNSINQIGDAIFECWFSPSTSESGWADGMLGVATDITDLKRSEDEHKRSRMQLRNLARHLQSIREEERARIAREIHDVLGQAMTVLKMDIMWLSQRITEEAVGEKIESMRELISSTIQTIRKIATELRPGILDDLGLGAALEWQAHEFESRTGIRCVVHKVDPHLEVDRDRATSLFRIFQELLTNVARHAGAGQIDVSLESTGSSILLTVQDNGRGIEPQEINNTRSLGLLGMRERALAWGGTIQFSGAAGKGTTVTVKIPMLLTEEREALQ